MKGKPSIRPGCAHTQASRTGSHVAPSSHSHLFDTALRAYSGQAADLQEATSQPGIRVAEYCLVINQWHRLLWPQDSG